MEAVRKANNSHTRRQRKMN